QAHESFVVGTPGYMAPEQWAFESLDARADVWAVGMLLHEVIFGHTAAKVPLGYSSLRCRTRWDTTGFSPSLRHIFAATLTMNPLDRAPQVTDLAIPLRQAAVELCEHQFGKLSPDERLVAAACSLLSLRSELTKRSLSTLKRITELSELAVERAWDGLVRRTIIAAGDAPHGG